MQIEGNHDGDCFTQDAARLPQQEALGIVFVFGLHGSVQGKVGRIHGARVRQAIEKLAAQAAEAGGAENPAGGEGAGPQAGHDLHPVVRLEDAQRTAHLLAHPAVVLQHPSTAHDAEVFVTARHGVEGRDFLLAFGDENPRHGQSSFS